jgi:hypothetical protein
MLEIERMRIRLPSELQARAATIARLVGEELARRPLTRSAALDELSVPDVRVRAGDSDSQIAARIAHGIHSRIEASSRSGSGPIARI